MVVAVLTPGPSYSYSDVLRNSRSSEASLHGSLLAMKQLLLHRTIQNGFDAVCGALSIACRSAVWGQTKCS